MLQLLQRWIACLDVKVIIWNFNNLLADPWHFYIATVETDEATFVRLCVTRGFVAHNLNRENEASLTEAISNNA